MKTRIPMTIRAKQMHRALIETDKYLRAGDLAHICRCSKSMVYTVIRKLREMGIPVQPTKHGYILSQFATEVDDVNFFRNANGKITSAIVMVNACAPHVQKRWRSEKRRSLLTSMVQPLEGVSLQSLRASMLTMNKELESMQDK